MRGFCGMALHEGVTVAYDIARVCQNGTEFVSVQLSIRTTPNHVDIVSVEWFYSLVMVLMGSCPSGE